MAFILAGKVVEMIKKSQFVIDIVADTEKKKTIRFYLHTNLAGLFPLEGRGRIG